jgi:hypothetical protein
VLLQFSEFAGQYLRLLFRVIGLAGVFGSVLEANDLVICATGFSSGVTDCEIMDSVDMRIDGEREPNIHSRKATVSVSEEVWCQIAERRE